MKRTAVLHAAGYVGRSLLERVLEHPGLELVSATSRSFAGKTVHDAHPGLAGRCSLAFDAVLPSYADLDVVFVAAGHGEGAAAAGQLRDKGYEGLIVDMSADFRLSDAATYKQRYGIDHPRTDLLENAWYGMPELTGPPPPGTTLIANPGCFATAISLALFPLSAAGGTPESALAGPVSVTALTGASGSGARPSATTHFPDRDANVRAYKVFRHQHEAEIRMMAKGVDFSFVPVSGPWTAGIWGTAQVRFKSEEAAASLAAKFEAAYADKPLIRLWPGRLPELLWSVRSPFTDLGWTIMGRNVVVGFAIDNLMKGAASQAIQNMNLAFGWSDTDGLVAHPATAPTS